MEHLTFEPLPEFDGDAWPEATALDPLVGGVLIETMVFEVPYGEFSGPLPEAVPYDTGWQTWPAE